MAGRILIVDDERKPSEAVANLLRMDEYAVDIAADMPAAVALLGENRYDAALVDLKMDHVDGLTVLKECRRIDPTMVTIMLTGHGTRDAAARAHELGAQSFLAKPVRHLTLKWAVTRAVEVSQCRREAGRSQQQLRDDPAFDAIIGNSPILHEAMNMARTAATSDLSVLILGETGTGKNMLAAAVHAASGRRDSPFVTASLAGVPDTLQRSALFGHAKGSFTGAETASDGFFIQANGGTLFLDEFGDITPETQLALLAAVEGKSIRPVGCSRDVAVDVRIVAATNRDLKQAIVSRSFRSDLYFRMADVTVVMPPLRDRLGDIPLLVTHFARVYAAKYKGCPTIKPEVMDRLCEYDWPGNVREMGSLMERAVVFAKGEPIGMAHCTVGMLSSDSLVDQGILDQPWKQARNLLCRKYVEKLLNRFDGDQSKVAKHAALHPGSVRRILRKTVQDHPANSDDCE